MRNIITQAPVLKKAHRRGWLGPSARAVRETGLALFDSRIAATAVECGADDDERDDERNDQRRNGDRALADQGVQHIFGYPGGAVLPIYDAIFQPCRWSSTSWCATSRARSCAAEGPSRLTGKVGCCWSRQVHSATNAVTSLTDALCDSVPIVVITGQVPTHLIGNDAFQECDTVGITSLHQAQLSGEAHRGPAARLHGRSIASSGRPGPVVNGYSERDPVRQRHLFKADDIPASGLQAPAEDDPGRIKEAVEHGAAPSCFTGGGVINSGPRASAGASWSSSPASRSPRR
jgi:acetolactate synthase-1/2/3 large subunit